MNNAYDRRGVEISEGDIVYYDNKEYKVVAIDQGYICLQYSKDGPAFWQHDSRVLNLKDPISFIEMLPV